MDIRGITERVLYVGVNDRVTDRFEGLWPLPYGVSYNSYIVKGDEKIALIDTVASSTSIEYIEKIRRTTGERSIDYLVINHMEPDHSGSIPAIAAAYPDIKLVGNRQTAAMVKGYYGIGEERFMIISDGDRIELGGATLRFAMTPMVHWPETMMTYLEEEKVLFAGDAFGCFGALNGGIVDETMDCTVYFEEMYRYYSNIVGKYGKFVQKAFQKLAGTEMDYICSTHGPVWHAEISRVVGIYDRLSKYEGEDGVTIIYGSMYGNTEVIAEAIARRLNERGIRKIRIHNASKSPMSDMINDAYRYKGLIVGAPTYSMRIFPPVEQFMNAMETREIKNKTMAFFGSFCWASATLGKLKEYGERMGHEIIDCIDMQHSATEATIERAYELADKVIDGLK